MRGCGELIVRLAGGEIETRGLRFWDRIPRSPGFIYRRHDAGKKSAKPELVASINSGLQQECPMRGCGRV